MEADRVIAPFAARLTPHQLAQKHNAASIEVLWDRLATRAFPFVTDPIVASGVDDVVPEDRARILAAAEFAMTRQVDLLGTGPIDIGEPVEWLKDLSTGDAWPEKFCRRIEYSNPERSSDVKIPWELSRLQWMISVGQAYMLTGDGKYAEFACQIFQEWIEANPYAWTVNWSCTMEPALRILTWTWFFHVFATSAAWADSAFRGRFLVALFLHGRFVELHIERARINGNHYSADAAGLVFAGLFFGSSTDAERWARQGWQILEAEIQTQVHPDGVDFEASTAYHRLVTELFVHPARYRRAHGLNVSQAFADRLKGMAAFATAYCRADGTSPFWGDADDGRAVPLGGQELSDHRYLGHLVASAIDDPVCRINPGSGASEVFWCDGCLLPADDVPVKSQAFPDGGVYILQRPGTHVFIDCGPVGLAGLGGHGHNDALSFEAWLSGQLVITDPGSFVYTKDFAARQLFRSTKRHNTLQVSTHEINRTYGPDNLWNLHEDARCKCLAFEDTDVIGRFKGRQSGYDRLDPPAVIEREITINFHSGQLRVRDQILGDGQFDVSVPVHFAPGVTIRPENDGFQVRVGEREFEAAFSGDDALAVKVEDYYASPSYGVKQMAQRLVCTAKVAGGTVLSFDIGPVR